MANHRFDVHDCSPSGSCVGTRALSGRFLRPPVGLASPKKSNPRPCSLLCAGCAYLSCGGPFRPHAADLENVIVCALSDLGFGPFFEEQLQRWECQPIIPARIAAEHRGGYEVWSDTGAGLARLAGKLRHRQDGESAPAVGDWVGLRYPPGPEETTVIDRLFARRTLFTRGAAGREALAQIVAANVDQVFVVCGLDNDFNLRRYQTLINPKASVSTPVLSEN